MVVWRTASPCSTRSAYTWAHLSRATNSWVTILINGRGHLFRIKKVCVCSAWVMEVKGRGGCSLTVPFFCLLFFSLSTCTSSRLSYHFVNLPSRTPSQRAATSLTHSLPLAFALIHSVAHSCTYSPLAVTHFSTHSPPHSRSHSLTRSLIHTLNQLLTHSTHSFPHSLISKLTHIQTHSLIHRFTKALVLEVTYAQSCWFS